MSHNHHPHTLKPFKRQLRAWGNHIEKLRLDDRLRFVEWLSKSFSSKDFALLLDAEIERPVLWKIYLQDRYGP